MAGHAQRDPAHHQRAHCRDEQSGKHREPGRPAHVDREVGAGIGAYADKGRLTEGGESANAGEQHQAQNHQAVKRDVIELGDPEIRHR